MDGAFHKAYTAFGAKSTDTSPVASVSDAQASWLPVPSVSDAQASWLPESKTAEPQGQRTMMDGAFHKAYAAYGAKSTDPNPVASFSDAQATWLPESQTAEP